MTNSLSILADFGESCAISRNFCKETEIATLFINALEAASTKSNLTSIIYIPFLSIGEPNDGVTHLLDALKAIQLAQTNITGSLNQLGSRANHVMFKKALNDEFEVLLCLKLCSKFEDGALKLVDHHSGK